MTFAFPEGLAPEVYPLAWLVGRWSGEGVLAYPGIEESRFRHDVSFDHDGGPYLRYAATMTLLDGADDGRIWQSETGYWRVAPQTPEGVELAEGQHPIEVLLADGAGVLTAYLGAVGNGRVDVASRFMAATESGPDMRGATRMYGNVEGRLLWAWDLSAFGNELQSYASAELLRLADAASSTES